MRSFGRMSAEPSIEKEKRMPTGYIPMRKHQEVVKQLQDKFDAQAKDERNKWEHESSSAQSELDKLRRVIGPILALNEALIKVSVEEKA